MKLHRRVWVAIILILIIVLPLISLFVMKQGYSIRKSTKPGIYFFDSGVMVPPYKAISQDSETITNQLMLGKVCVYELYTDSCLKAAYPEQHALFKLQEDYYGKTKLLRFISVSMDDEGSFSSLRYNSSRFAAREIWHFVQTDAQTREELKNSFHKTLTNKSPASGNLLCPGHVFLVDKKGEIRGNYFISEKEQFSALYNDILYLIDQDL